MAGYSAFRIFEESLRVDPSEHFLGLRLNMYVASVLTIAGIAWFAYSQRHGRPAAELPQRPATAGRRPRRIGPGPDGRDPAEPARAQTRPAGPGAAESSEAARATDTA